MFDQLNAVARTVHHFLVDTYGGDSGDWYEQKILKALSYNQRETARRENWTTIGQLDLQALLRVVDQNWWELEQRVDGGKDARNWLKEMQGVRNRWSHVSGAGGPSEDQRYRDLDTMARLAEALGGAEAELERLRDARGDTMRALAGVAIAPEPASLSGATEVTPADEARPLALVVPTASGALEAGPPEPPTQTAGLGVGTSVELVSNPERSGVVVGVIPGAQETQYVVFHSATDTRTYYASQVRARGPADAIEWLSARDLKAAFTSFLIREGSSRDLFSLNSGRIDFEPYQFRPVMKLLGADRQRLLIADDVGVGKTIEAGLIIKELSARQELESILIVCPKPLVTARKWVNEMKRFDEDFIALDGPTLRYCIDEMHADGEWPRRYRRSIVPYSLLDERLLLGDQSGRKRRRGLAELDPPPSFDLIIVDEAHHVRNRSTLAHQNLDYLMGTADAAVFLSATPIQTRSEDLFVLLNMLRPDLFTNVPDFYDMVEPNQHITVAAAAARGGGEGWRDRAVSEIEMALATSWGSRVIRSHPQLPATMALLEAEEPSDVARVHAVAAIESLNTFSTVINRTRRRDIGEFTVRKAETVAIDFSPGQRVVFDRLFEVSEAILEARGSEMSTKFLLSTLHRQAASSINGLGGLVEDILARRLIGDDTYEFESDSGAALDSGVLAVLAADISEVATAARALGDADPKYDGFARILREKIAMESNKSLVFSTFRHTLAYLRRRLDGDGFRVGVVHGGIGDDDREEIRRRFALPSTDPTAIDVLLSSEIGTEGLDYQFCDLLVNYDIPWNPMRVEQRIGRIDRRGQRSEAVVIKNLITPGTIDAEVYERCLMRIGVFEHALGGGEEILGQLAQELTRIAEDFTLSDAEKRKKLQQLSDNQVARVRELENLEAHEAELIGLDVRHAHAEAVNAASSIWLASASLADLVDIYLSRLEPGVRLSTAPGGELSLRASKGLKDRLLDDATARKANNGEHARWVSWLKSDEPVRRFVLSAQDAQGRSDVELLHAGHPIAAAAANAMDASASTVQLEAQSADVPAGTYPFAAYTWVRHGARDESSLRFVSTDSVVEESLSTLIASATDANDLGAPAVTAVRELEDRAFTAWSTQLELHRESVGTYVSNRIASLEYSQRSRVASLEAQRDRVSDERIVRMRDSQISRAMREFETKRGELESSVGRADIVSERCAVGLIRVVAP